MRFLAVIAVLLLLAAEAGAGTLIYKNRAGEKKRVSGLTILSIDGKKMIVKVNDGTETIMLSQVLKYYDTDLRSGGEFDDDSAEYSIRLGEGKISGDKKKNGRKTFELDYDVTRKSGKNNAGMRQPYFYLFILSTGSEGQRQMTSYSFPDAARVNLKNYDEAKMLEKVLSLKRPYLHRGDSERLGWSSSGTRMGGGKTAVFPLNKLRAGKVIAWYVVAWGKDEIVASKEWRDHSFKISKTWWIR